MNPLHHLALMGLGSTEIIVVLAILILLFGATRIPQLARGMGLSIKEFKNATKDEPEPAKPGAAKVLPAAEQTRD